MIIITRTSVSTDIFKNRLLDMAASPLNLCQSGFTDCRSITSVISIRKSLEKNLSAVEVDFSQKFGGFWAVEVILSGVGPKGRQSIATVRAWIKHAIILRPEGPSVDVPALRASLTFIYVTHALTGVAIDCRPFGPPLRRDYFGSSGRPAFSQASKPPCSGCAFL
jgi:hypothetical protein